MAFLAVTSGVPRQVLVLTPGVFTAGRSPEAALELAHVEISRIHCRFTWDGSICAIEDLGSFCGTLVNGLRIQSLTKLRDGDKVSIGPVGIEFGVGAPPVIEKGEATSERLALMLVNGAPSDRIPVTGETIIGREPKGDVVLSDPGVSRRHAKVSLRPGGGSIVTDLNSSAGSFVNGHRFDEHELTVGDRLQIGPFCFQFDGQSLVRVANAAGGSIRASGVFFRVGNLTILDNVSVTLPPSRFIGIIGPSGAGQSSFLHVLAGLHAPQSGTVLADGVDVYANNAAPSFGFVPQEDIVHPELTIVQALRFSAKLRLPGSTPKLELQKLLVQTMDQLGIIQRADVSIARLSGGQRKRVSVGVELLAKPGILFLDEPTSGLDPATEFQLMELLRGLADTGCTIICTTHVMENAYLMDQMAVLVSGCLAFHGSQQEAREYFKVTKLNALYDQLSTRTAKEWQNNFQLGSATEEQALEKSSARAPATKVRTAMALPILLQRQWTILSSDWRNFIILLGQPLVIASLVSWVTNERALVMFFAYLATLWFGCSNAAQEIVKERAIYRRERLIGVGPHSYLTSKFLFLTAITGAQALIDCRRRQPRRLRGLANRRGAWDRVGLCWNRHGHLGLFAHRHAGGHDRTPDPDSADRFLRIYGFRQRNVRVRAPRQSHDAKLFGANTHGYELPLESKVEWRHHQ